jgi:hypothetical protein
MGYFDQATETLPREQLAALQLGKLQAMIEGAVGPQRLLHQQVEEPPASPPTTFAASTTSPACPSPRRAS